ncbi:MAG: hypothetical protein KDE56_09765 [Anaerolineales bacterium]|nr:hypothetical protein [Anaerolineales bacterium]
MSQPALIGVDLGSTNIKAVAFGLGGEQLAQATTPTITHVPRPGWAEYGAEEVWTAVCSVLRQLLANLPANAVPAAVTCSSMAEAGVALDAHGQPLYPFISWFDQRTIPQAEQWARHIGEETTAKITGLGVRPVYGIFRLLWLRDNAPDLFRRTRRWLNMADYGAFRLCGATATDYSLASRMLLLDLARKEWSATLLEANGLDGSVLGELVPSGTQVGRVSSQAAAETGLPAGLPVCSGGHDHVCGAFGLGLTQVGDTFDSMGTAESLMMTTAAPQLDGSVTRRQIGQGVHVAPNRYYAMSGVQMSGGAVDWVRRLLLGAALGDAATPEGYEQLMQLAGEAPPGSGGVFFVPHLRRANPPHVNPHARGAFVGITGDSSRSHLARAVLEGVAYEYQLVLENMAEAVGVQPSKLVATGGGTRNGVWMGIKTAVSGLPITIPAVDEAVCLGAAMLAGVGSGVYASFADAAAQVQFASRTIQCDPTLHQFYRQQYEQIYKTLYGALRETNELIRKGIVGRGV